MVTGSWEQRIPACKKNKINAAVSLEYMDFLLRFGLAKKI